MDSWTLNSRIKKILNDIIDVAYSEESVGQRSKYKKFTLRILDSQMRSKNGDYHRPTAEIRIFNPCRDGRLIAKTCLHELAHHIDYTCRGNTGHQQSFYEEYARLIYAALNMRILDLADYANLTDWSTDSKKVRKILDAWSPAFVDYRLSDRSIVKVKNCYKQKQALKEKGYLWNSIESNWEKEISSDNIEEELMDLTALGLQDVEAGPLDLSINPAVVILATGDTYPVRNILKENGFHFDKRDKFWTKKTTNIDAEEEIRKLKEIPDLRLISFQYK